MRITRLVFQEIRYRRLTFVLGVLAIAIAVGGAVAQISLLRKHDLGTERFIAAQEAQTREKMNQFEDDTRKITVNMGFNLLILPRGQNLTDLYDDQLPLRYMPEDYAQRLARSQVATINHVLPSLTQRILWPERHRKIMLMGVRGEVYVQSAKQKPILEAVPPGSMVVGYELHQSLGLKVGDKVQLMGREFVVSKLRDERGNWDDVTIWIDLKQAQELLQHPGQINAILALECNCQKDRLALIREEIGAILPDTQIVEFASQAVARAEMRNRAAAEAQATVARAQESRRELRAQRESFAATLVPLLTIGAAIWIALLAIGNVRARKAEIGLLGALGLRARQIMALFLCRALVTGLAGACLGYIVGIAFALPWQGMPLRSDLVHVAIPELFPIALVVAPAIAILASLAPAMMAAQEDPAVVLQRE